MLGGRVNIREVWRPGKLDQYGRKSWRLRGSNIDAVFFVRSRRLRNLDGTQSTIDGTLEVGCGNDINQTDILTFDESNDQYEVYSVEKNNGIDGCPTRQQVMVVKLKRRLSIP